jgi:hypothetical protein
MKLGRDPGKWLQKKAKRGVVNYPVGTVAFYGPDDRRASKVAASVVLARDSAEPAVLRRWFSETGDLRRDGAVLAEIALLFQEHGVRSVGMIDSIIGCPHEEGIDYPDGEACPQCPFWAGRDRWAGLPRSH